MYHAVCHLFSSSIKHCDFAVLSVCVFMVFILAYDSALEHTDYLVFMYKSLCTACKGQCQIVRMILFIIPTLNAEQCFIIFIFPASL